VARRKQSAIATRKRRGGTKARGGRPAAPLVIAKGLRAARKGRIARGDVAASTFEAALQPRWMLEIELPEKAASVLGDVAVVESEPCPSLRAVIFGADRRWSVTGGAREIEQSAFPDKITVALPPGSTLVLNGTRPSVTYRNGEERGLDIEVTRREAVPAAQLVETLADEFSLEPWLVSLARQLVAQRGRLASFVGLGALARLWVTGVAPERRRAMTRRVLDGEGLGSALARWRQTEGAARWAEAEEAVRAEVRALSEELGRLARVPAERRGARDRMAALRWLLRREDLACVAEIAAGGVTVEVDRALAELDKDGQRHADVFVDVEVSADPRLARAQLVYPDAWWLGVGW
jgi:hypothetical protein